MNMIKQILIILILNLLLKIKEKQNGEIKLI